MTGIKFRTLRIEEISQPLSFFGLKKKKKRTPFIEPVKRFHGSEVKKEFSSKIL